MAAGWVAQLDKGALRRAAQAARQWLADAAEEAAKAAELARVMAGLVADGYLVGEQASREVLRLEPIDWSSWEPGNTAAAERILDDEGRGDGLRKMLAEVDVTVKSVAAERFDDMARVLFDGAARGDSAATLAKDLKETLKRPDRAEMIAVTETARAVSQASQDQYKAHGVGQNEWLIAPDSRVCLKCSGNADEGPVDVGSAFSSGHEIPPAHPRCRCALMPVIDLDALDFGDLGKATGRDNNQLREYWLTGEGAARWSSWTDLYHHLREHVSDERAKRIAAQWFHDRYGRWPGDKRNRKD